MGVPFLTKPPIKIGKSKGSATVPGTQPKMGKTRPQAAAVMKTADLGQGYMNAKRIAKANPNVKDKHVVPRAKISTRATPKAEY